MDEKFIGRICPYCKQPIEESDDIVVCEDCGTAMHTSCREITRECVAVGCRTVVDCEAEPETGMQEIAEPDEPIERETPPPPRSSEDIYNNPSFCPACGTRIENAPQCPACGLVFADRSFSAPPAPKPKQKAPMAALAIAICAALCVLVIGVIMGVKIGYSERMEELGEELRENVWQCQQITDAVFADSPFVMNCYITFDRDSMDVTVSSMFFGSSQQSSTPYTVISPTKIRLGSGDDVVEYDVETFEVGDAETMRWTAPDGSVLIFTEAD